MRREWTVLKPWQQAHSHYSHNGYVLSGKSILFFGFILAFISYIAYTNYFEQLIQDALKENNTYDYNQTHDQIQQQSFLNEVFRSLQDRNILLILLSILIGISSSMFLIYRQYYHKSQGGTQKNLMKNARQYAEHITQEEYLQQSQEHTRREILKLQNSAEYASMLKSKGNDQRNWNWQVRKVRPLEEIEEEQEYLKNVEQISNQVPKDQKIKEKEEIDGYFDSIQSSTKESSEKSNEENSMQIRNSRYDLREISKKKYNNSQA